jgi:Tol biopolymer transport system component
MSPDGKEIYFTVRNGASYFIAESKMINGVWTEPEFASFSGNTNYNDLEPFISQDGKKFYFMSTRAPKGKEQKAGWFYQNIWLMDKTAEGWSEPYLLEGPVNTDSGQYYPTLTNDGTIYYTHEEAKNVQMIYRSSLVDGKYQTPERLPKEVNPTNMQYNSMVAPDESYIILCTFIEGNSIGRSDYYISFNKGNDSWTPLMNMGKKVNFPNAHGLSPSLSPDGKYFIFSSNKQIRQEKPVLKEIKKSAISPQNGNLDLYWIKTDFIEELRKEALKKQ